MRLDVNGVVVSIFVASDDDGGRMAADTVWDDGVVVVEETVSTIIPEAAFLKSSVPSGGPIGTSGMKFRKESGLWCWGG